MTDYNYSLGKDSTRTVPLYHHEHVPYEPLYRHTNNNTLSDQNNTTLSAASGDLQEIIYSYQSQPDLLKLILSSKLEEDKRRAEEAKLRAKELDLLLSQQSLNNTPFDDNQQDYAHLFQSSLNNNFAAQTPIRHNSLDAIINPLLPPQHTRRDSTLGSSFTADSDDLDDPSFSPITTTTSTPSLLHMDSYQPMVMSSLNNKSIDDNSPDNPRPSQRLSMSSKPRRRREMQAITKIVETREFPYIDGYFWKNNGNTVQKKTGNKSVYYKCSNSNKGCPVNKTVTWKANEEYLIKYRGEHLLECNKVQRIVDV